MKPIPANFLLYLCCYFVAQLKIAKDFKRLLKATDASEHTHRQRRNMSHFNYFTIAILSKFCARWSII